MYICAMKTLLKKIGQWYVALAKAFVGEWHIVLRDAGVLVFFILLPIAYPIVYTLVYNPEVVENIPVAVVDNSRTAASRAFTRDVGATSAIEIYAYCANLEEARTLMAEGEVFGILDIPSDYSKDIGRGETSNVMFYADMSLLLRYRTLAFALTEVQIATIGDITAERVRAVGAPAASLSGMPVTSESFMLGATQQGFASFVMPGILILILQQSMILGAALIVGTSRKRRRLNVAVDSEMDVERPFYAVVWGKALCYAVLYIAPAIFALHYIPYFFDLPHSGSAVDYMLFVTPLLLASGFFGMTLGWFVKEREAVFLIVVVTSVFFLFLSGLTWPRYVMPDFWNVIGDFVPSTWGIEGFIRINTNDATLAESSTPYYWLWGLTLAYSILAAVTARIRR